MNTRTDTGAQPGAVHVAAFGKHPGWNDHLDDLGLDTAALVAAKRALYLDGVRGNIDAGAWEKLEATHRLEGFRHVFLWRTCGSLLAGRMWASRDGKGRARYPMVACVEQPACSAAWLVSAAFPRLEALEQACRQTLAADDVRRLVEEARVGLQAAAAGAESEAWPAWFGDARALAELAAGVCTAENPDAFLRVLYKVERDAVAYTQPPPLRGAAPAPQHLRVPAGDAAETRSLALWMGLLLTVLDPATPLFVARPLGADWVDVVLGAPATPQFYCLLATPAALPRVSDIPYTLDEAVRTGAVKRIEGWRAGLPALDPAILRAAVEGNGLARQLFGGLRSLFGGRG